MKNLRYRKNVSFTKKAQAKKVKISATPSQFFLNNSQTKKARQLRFSPIDLEKNST
jgi:hypothetical protein